MRFHGEGRLMKFFNAAILILLSSIAYADGYSEFGDNGAISANSCTTDNALIVNDGTDGAQLQCSVNSTHTGTLTISPDISGSQKMLTLRDDTATLFDFGLQAGSSRLQCYNSAGTLKGVIDPETANVFRILTNTNIALTLQSDSDDVRIVGDNMDVQTVLQLDTTTLTVSSGAVTATRSYHVINGEGAAADVLDTINGGAQGDILTIERGDADITLDCVAGAGNLSCPGAAADILLADEQIHSFLFNGSLWISLVVANP